MTLPAPPFADPQDVAAVWRPLTDTETTLAAGLLADASVMILEIPAVAARIVSGLLVDATLRSVCAQMVLRAMLNPQRLAQFSVTVDDASRSGTFDSVNGSQGVLGVSSAELDRLLGRVAAAAAFSAVQPWLLVSPPGSSVVNDSSGYPWGYVAQLLDPSA